MHRQRTVWLGRPVEVLDVYPSHTWIAKVFKLVPLACFVSSKLDALFNSEAC